MAGRHPFSQLRARMPKEAQARIHARAALASREMDLGEVRRALKLSQEELADTLGVGQAAVAKLEKRADMYVSTLRRFIEAMGGELEIVAHFPDHDITIKSFRDVASEREPA